jgi:hypothetical protein
MSLLRFLLHFLCTDTAKVRGEGFSSPSIGSDCILQVRIAFWDFKLRLFFSRKNLPFQPERIPLCADIGRALGVKYIQLAQISWACFLSEERVSKSFHPRLHF